MIRFGTDGWRGIIADDFTFQNVRYAAQGIANFLRARPEHKVVIGYDCRFGADRFAQEVARITAAAGIKTYLTDAPSPTQVSSWTILELQADGAIVLTASHNPAAFLGIKYKPEYAGSASPEVVAELEAEIAAVIDADQVGLIDFQEALDGGAVEVIDPRPAYHRQISKMVDLDAIRAAGLKILHDPMYGSGAGYVADIVGPGGPTRVDQVRAERNPGFGGIHPEPIPQNLRATLDLMRQGHEGRMATGEGGWDLGIATDGDADRVGIVDETGTFVNQLQVYALLMDYLLGTLGWRGPVVRTLTSTSMADRLAQIHGVECHEVQVGFKYVGPKMIETGAVMGGEESGGFGFRGHIPERDGILAGLYFADMIVKAGRPLSRILAELTEKVGPHFYDRRDVNLPREAFEEIKSSTYQRFGAAMPAEVAGSRVVRTRSDDGFKLYLEDGAWVLVRFSGTEPLLRIYSEAPSRERVAELIGAIAAHLGLDAANPNAHA
ncbi:MAG TPA: phosphoglucomutase/phosphomannomutase family protein [Candidatus Dormibacteraeota bacterium]|nr:phosphoglucomutase/phosphomannomutase family protein [Candidatus Dormibacteraeota bacterium]